MDAGSEKAGAQMDDRLLNKDAPPTTVVSDALDELGIFGVMTGLFPVRESQRIMGRALTGIVTESKDGGVTGLSDLLERAAPGDVLVLGWCTSIEASVFGGLAARRAELRGCVGLVVDGWVRDIDELAGRFSVWSKGATPKTGRGRIAVKFVDYPVSVGSVEVRYGDTIVADETGVCVLPELSAGQLLESASLIAENDGRVERALLKGEDFEKAHGNGADASRR